MPPDRTRLRRVSTAMAAATVLLALLLTAAAVYVWLDDSALSRAARAAMLPVGPVIGDGIQWAGLIAGLPLLGLILWSLWNAFALFRGYAAGDMVTARAGRRIGRIGLALLLIPVVSTLTGMLAGVLVTWDAPGGRQLVVSVSSNALVMAVIGAVLVMVGRATAEAARIADEYRQFV